MADIPHLVDLQAIADLRGVEVSDGQVSIGAMTTLSEPIASDALRQAAAILREAALQIADPQVRNVGTVAGNVANGDPGNDMPALMLCLDARFALVGSGGSRKVAARELYEAAYMTARGDEKIPTRVMFSAPQRGQAYDKLKRKTGDYATAAAALVLQKDADVCSAAVIAMTNLSDVPVFSPGACQALVGTDCGETAVHAAVQAMLADIDPAEHNRGPLEFKKHVAGIVLRRAIARACRAPEYGGADGKDGHHADRER